MYIKVVVGENAKSDIGDEVCHPPAELLLNPDCPIRIIYDCIQQCCGIAPDLEFDLCDDNGNLVSICEKEPWINGLNCLLPKTTYIVVLFERDEDNRVTNFTFHIPDAFRKSGNQWSDIMARVKKQLNPGQNTKASRPSRTRASLSAVPK